MIFLAILTASSLWGAYWIYQYFKLRSYRHLLEKSPKRVVVIGGGFSGIGIAIQFQKRGFEVVIIEKAHELGGTWMQNTYPGCACDVPVHLYSFSFEPKHDWDLHFAGQQSILDYIRGLVTKYSLNRLAKLNTKVLSAKWNSASKKWTVAMQHCRTNAISEELGDFVVLATGQLGVPRTPDFPGVDQFKGIQMHTSLWDHSQQLAGKTVAVIGTGASAVQVVPELAQIAKKVIVVQRTPPYVVSKNDFNFPKWMKDLFYYFPFARAIFRAQIYFKNELAWLAFKGTRGPSAALLRAKADSQRLNQLAGEQNSVIRDALKPAYEPGCKRVMTSDNFYPTFLKPHVSLLQGSLTSLSSSSIQVSQQHGGLIDVPVDAVVYATGFDSLAFCAPIEVYGEHDMRLSEYWGNAPRAYLGMTIPNFPNLFMTLGPNTALGHNTVLFMTECQINYFLDLLEKMLRLGKKTFTVKKTVADAFDIELQRQLSSSRWKSGCQSWYQNSEGRVVSLWYGSSLSYWWTVLYSKVSDFVFE